MIKDWKLIKNIATACVIGNNFGNLQVCKFYFSASLSILYKDKKNMDLHAFLKQYYLLDI